MGDWQRCIQSQAEQEEIGLARWKPAHQDPAKAERPPGSRRTRCVWIGCDNSHGFRFDLPLCSMHVGLVIKAYDEERHVAEQRVAAREQAKIDAAARAVEKVEQGFLLEDDEPVPGWIYYVRLDGVIKIGYTKNLHRRIKEYAPTAVLLATEPGTPKLERQRHQHFGKDLAVGREWFTESDELTTWINTLVEAYGEPDPSIGRYTTPLDGPRTGPTVGARRVRQKRYC